MRSGSIKPPALQVSAQSLPGLSVVCLELEPQKKNLESLSVFHQNPCPKAARL